MERKGEEQNQHIDRFPVVTLPPAFRRVPSSQQGAVGTTICSGNFAITQTHWAKPPLNFTVTLLLLSMTSPLLLSSVEHFIITLVSVTLIYDVIIYLSNIDKT